MTKEVYFGQPFAYGFYQQQLADAQRNSVFAFSQLVPAVAGKLKSDSILINILWRSAAIATCFPKQEVNPIRRRDLQRRQSLDITAVQNRVERKYPGALYRGLFTTGNYLLARDRDPLKVVGPLIVLKDFKDGAIHRVDPPRCAEELWRLRTGREGIVVIRNATLGDG